MVAGGLAVWQLQYAYLVGLPLGMAIYWILMKLWIIPTYPQAELDTPVPETFLGTSVGCEWAWSGARDVHQAKVGTAGEPTRKDA